MDIVGLYKTRRPDSGEISSRGFIYYWFGMNNGARLKGLAIGISSSLQLSVVEVTPVDERIVPLRLMHTLAFMCLVAVYAPTEICKADEGETFYAKLDCTGPVPSTGQTDCLGFLGRLQCCFLHCVLVPMALVLGTPIALMNFAKSWQGSNSLYNSASRTGRAST